MNSRFFPAFFRHAVLVMVAIVSAFATLLPQPVTASIQSNFDVPTATQVGHFNPYT